MPRRAIRVGHTFGDASRLRARLRWKARRSVGVRRARGANVGLAQQTDSAVRDVIARCANDTESLGVTATSRIADSPHDDDETHA